MRLVLIIGLCFGLLGCSRQPPHVQMLHTLPAMPPDLGHFQLVSPQDATDSSQRTRLSLIDAQLIRGLHNLGYRESTPAQFRVIYHLQTRNVPMIMQTDSPPPAPLGPYRAVHSLRHETILLHIRWTDMNDKTLWEATVSTPLSPARKSVVLLRAAVDEILGQMPRRVGLPAAATLLPQGPTSASQTGSNSRHQPFPEAE